MMIRYIVPFPVMSAWLDSCRVTDDGALDIPYQDYIAMIRRLLEPVAVDEAWYAAAYPAVGQAIARGVVPSAGFHYLAHGYFENRLPFAAERTDVRAPVPFRDIRAATPVRAARGELRVVMPRETLLGIVGRLLHAVPVDEAWYRQTYPGVAAAIERGGFTSASSHYAQYGYTEARWPFAMRVEEDWYLGRYPDVRKALAAGTVASAQEHFWRAGYREGRFPARTPLQS